MDIKQWVSEISQLSWSHVFVYVYWVSVCVCVVLAIFFAIVFRYVLQRLSTTHGIYRTGTFTLDSHRTNDNKVTAYSALYVHKIRSIYFFADKEICTRDDTNCVERTATLLVAKGTLLLRPIEVGSSFRRNGTGIKSVMLYFDGINYVASSI